MPELSEQKSVSTAVVIPCFRVREQILDVLSSIGKEITNIYVIDDACPENTRQYVEKHCSDPRVTVVQHELNQGVGGATITGYQHALTNGVSIIIKMDGDGQMDASSIPGLATFGRPPTGPIAAVQLGTGRGRRTWSTTCTCARPGAG